MSEDQEKYAENQQDRRCRVISPAVKRLEVVAGILWRDQRFLAAQRPPGSVQEGWWEFPGGKLEAGESAEQALARELREELGVRTEQADFWRTVEHVYTEPPRHVVLHFYHVRCFSGEPRSREGQALCWVTREEAAQLPFLEADLPIVREL